MFTPLLKSERFITEYEKFQSEIAKITDNNIRSSLEGELLTLRGTVQALDESHERVTFGERPGSEVDDYREKIRSLRQSIDTKLRAWQLHH
jgi:hypothetical protein